MGTKKKLSFQLHDCQFLFFGLSTLLYGPKIVEEIYRKSHRYNPTKNVQACFWGCSALIFTESCFKRGLTLHKLLALRPCDIKPRNTYKTRLASAQKKCLNSRRRPEGKCGTPRQKVFCSFLQRITRGLKNINTVNAFMQALISKCSLVVVCGHS